MTTAAVVANNDNHSGKDYNNKDDDGNKIPTQQSTFVLAVDSHGT
jgi:hypothetical protein